MAFAKINECLYHYIQKNSKLTESHMNNDVCNSMFEDTNEQSNNKMPEIIGQKKLPDDFLDWMEAHICWDGSEPAMGYLLLGTDTEYDGKDPDFLDEHDWGKITDQFDWQVFGYKIDLDTNSSERPQITRITPIITDVKANTEDPTDTFLAPSGYNYDVRLTPEDTERIKKLAIEYLEEEFPDQDEEFDDEYDVESEYEDRYRWDKEDYDRLDDRLSDEYFNYYDKYH